MTPKARLLAGSFMLLIATTVHAGQDEPPAAPAPPFDLPGDFDGPPPPIAPRSSLATRRVAPPFAPPFA